MQSSIEDNIHVAIRFRPLTLSENKEKIKTEIDLTSGNIFLEEKKYNFTFDYIFDFNSTQEEIFEFLGKKTVSWVNEGYNSTIFAFGPSGSGKTHSLFGSSKDKGLIPRCCETLFFNLSNTVEYTVKCSFVEIYRENLRDLLRENSRENLREENSLRIRQDSKKGMYVQGCIEKIVYTSEDILKLIKNGAEQRATAHTNLNDTSSRSHAVLSLYVQQKTLDGSVLYSKLHLVDLAGSENIGKSEVTGVNLQEAQQINKSLSCLGNVIYALTEKGRIHIPYRDSKLTYLLQDSLGGNSRTIMLCTAILKQSSLFETINTLKFAQRVKQIRNNVKKNKESTTDYKEIILSLQNRIAELEMKYTEALNTIEEMKKIEIVREEREEKEEEQTVNKSTKIIEFYKQKENIFSKKNFRLQKKIENLQKEISDFENKERKFEDILEEEKNLVKKLTCEIHKTKTDFFNVKNKLEILEGFLNSIKESDSIFLKISANFATFLKNKEF